jgi:uncharacterized membrane protein (DUF373 family)
MIYKILGLVLMTPLLAIILNYQIYKRDGKKWSQEKYNVFFEKTLVLLIMIEGFGFGIYFLFK